MQSDITSWNTICQDPGRQVLGGPKRVANETRVHEDQPHLKSREQKRADD